MASKAVVCASAVLLLALVPVTQCQSVGYFSPLTNQTVATFVGLTGDMQLKSVYQLENDIPEQRAALETLYAATAGSSWSSSYSSTVYLEMLAELATNYPLGATYDLPFSEFAAIFTAKVPWFTPGFSYCHWWGITCCLTASESVLPGCSDFQSIGTISLLGANLNGSIPTSIFKAFPDIGLLFIGQNPGLTGQVIDVPVSWTANVLILNLVTTSLQNTCATPSADGRNATWNATACFGNFFLPELLAVSSVAQKPGLSCPGIGMQRPSWLSPLTTAYNFQYVYADPMLVSYFNCSCAKPLRARYWTASSGLFQMECIADQNHSRLISIVAPLGSLAVVAFCVAMLLLAYRTRLEREWLIMRINNLKRRHAPGTLMERHGKGMEVFQNGMSIVMTDVEGSTALWEWNSRVMNLALALHDHTLRSLLPKYFGYEVTTEGDAFVVAFHDPIDAVGWALHVQLALLEAPWPPEVLQHPQARVDVCPEGKLLFRGLRVRMAINTGVPAEIIVHNMTKQVEYRGEMVELTEALTHLPAGGQVVLSDVTYRRTARRLLEVQLPAFTFKCARTTLEAITNQALPKAEDMGSPSAIDTPSSAEGLLHGQVAGEFSPHAATPSQAQLQQAKRAPWFSFRQAGSSPDMQIDVSPAEASQRRRRTSNDIQRRSTSISTETTAFASERHSTCCIIDMGSYLLSECRNRPYTPEDAALPRISGEHVVQILPQALVDRAGLFPAMDVARQVAPSFFDAPGVKAASSVSAVKPKRAGTLSASPSRSAASVRRFTQDQPELAFAYVSEFGYKEAATIDRQLASVALGQFKSCVRTTLLLCDGYECQETEGAFLVAFSSPRAALEWALVLQLALLRVHWSEALLSLAPTQEEVSPTGQVLSRGLSAKVGIFHGTIARLSPHGATGRAEYASSALDRASRLWAACNAGQVLVEQSLVEAVGLEWRGIQGVALPSEAPSHLALRNHALLLHRAQSDLAASKLASTTSSISSVIGRRMLSNRRQSTMPSNIQKIARNSSLKAGQPLRSSGSLTPRALSRQASKQVDGHDVSLDLNSRAAKSLETGVARRLIRQITGGVPDRPKPRRSSMLQPPRSSNGPATDLQSAPSEYEQWMSMHLSEAPIPITSAWTPGISKLLSGNWYSNTAYRRTGSLSRGNSLQIADAAEAQEAAQTGPPAAGHVSECPEAKQKGTRPEDVHLTSQVSGATMYINPLGPSGEDSSSPSEAGLTGPEPKAPTGAVTSCPGANEIPGCSVDIHVHHMGEYSFKGTADKFELCQAFPASLSERKASYLEIAANSNGKLICTHKEDSMAVTVSVKLPDILQLPLAAEPPLYVNVMEPKSSMQSSLRSSGHTRTTGIRSTRLTRMTNAHYEPV